MTPQEKLGFDIKKWAEEELRSHGGTPSYPDFTTEAGVKKSGWVKLLRDYEKAILMVIDIGDDKGGHL